MSKRATPTTTVPINGAAVRSARIDQGIEVADLACRIGISRAYLTNLELGHKRRTSPTVYAALLRALGQQDRDAFRIEVAA